MPTDAREIVISKISFGQRHRQSMGDVGDLCRSIESVGLLHPVVLTKQFKLIAGARRIEAFKSLGRERIPAVIIKNLSDAQSLLKAERDENICRVDFTPFEAIALGRSLEQLERPKAKERMISGKAPSGKLPEGGGETRQKVGEAVGMSGKTYSCARAVVTAAEEDPDTFGPIAEEMNRTGKIKPAFEKVMAIKKGKRPVPPPSSNGSGKKPVGVLRANEAIDCLMKIPKNDAHRKRGFQIVTDWIRLNK